MSSPTESIQPRRVALITGGARRIGRAIAHRLAAAGFDIAFTYLTSEAEAAELIAELQRAGHRALGIRADLMDPPAAVEAIGRQLLAWSDRLDVLIHSASVYEAGTLRTVSSGQLRRAFAIHAEFPLLICQRFEQSLRGARGSIIMMTDVLAEHPWPDYLAYCASKAALANITVALAHELAPEVTANAIAPSVVQWPEDQDEKYRTRYLARIPLKRPGTPSDVAEVVHFLCTRGKYITGQTLRVDGGYSIT